VSSSDSDAGKALQHKKIASMVSGANLPQHERQVHISPPKTATPRETPGLSDEERSVEAAVNACVRRDPEQFISEYLGNWGTTISTDAAAQLFHDYNQSLDHRSRNRRAVHAAAQWVADTAFWRLLEQPPTGAVRFMAGGTAAGKPTAVGGMSKGKGAAEIVYDTTLNSFPSAVARMDAALESGRPVRVLLVLAAPVAAYSRAVSRAIAIGRVVPIDYHKMTHRESPRTVLKLIEHYSGSPHVTFWFVDNSGASPKIGSEQALRASLPVDPNSGSNALFIHHSPGGSALSLRAIRVNPDDELKAGRHDVSGAIYALTNWRDYQPRY
jgi:hypothetical protein